MGGRTCGGTEVNTSLFCAVRGCVRSCVAVRCAVSLGVLTVCVWCWVPRGLLCYVAVYLVGVCVITTALCVISTQLVLRAPLGSHTYTSP